MKSPTHARASVSQNLFRGIFAGWGESQVVAVRYAPDNINFLTLADTKAAWERNEPNASTIDTKSYQHIEEHRRSMGLTLLRSVPMVGNDLLSSVLYTAGNTAVVSGKLGPLGLISVTVMLYFYRMVYQETVSAIPNNGGVYNALLNTAPKKLAALASCLSILSYTATALVSGFESIVYLSQIWTGLDIRGGTIVVFGAFAVINIMGVGESANVALALFIVHICMLTLLTIWSIAYGFQDNFKIFMENTRQPYPQVIDTGHNILADNDAGYAWFYGFSAGLLGISGFESAANYVEEMVDCDVFVNTLNVMWYMSGIYNPLMGLVSMFVLPLDQIYFESHVLLARMGFVVGGTSFQNFICIDAFLVLCGAVLTSYVGITGLIRRLAQDKILPGMLLKTNSRGSNHRIIICFFLLTSSLFLAIFNPDDPKAIGVFGGVYALAFLLVMLAFALANLALKIQRPSIPRLVICPYWAVFACIGCVSIGIVGNILLTPIILQWFFIYFAGFMGVVFFMFQRINILRVAMIAIRYLSMSKEDQVKQQEYNESLIAAHRLQEKVHIEHEAEAEAAAARLEAEAAAQAARLSASVSAASAVPNSASKLDNSADVPLSSSAPETPSMVSSLANMFSFRLSSVRENADRPAITTSATPSIPVGNGPVAESASPIITKPVEPSLELSTVYPAAETKPTSTLKTSRSAEDLTKSPEKTTCSAEDDPKALRALKSRGESLGSSEQAIEQMKNLSDKSTSVLSSPLALSLKTLGSPSTSAPLYTPGTSSSHNSDDGLSASVHKDGLNTSTHKKGRVSRYNLAREGSGNGSPNRGNNSPPTTDKDLFLRPFRSNSASRDINIMNVFRSNSASRGVNTASRDSRDTNILNVFRSNSASRGVNTASRDSNITARKTLSSSGSKSVRELMINVNSRQSSSLLLKASRSPSASQSRLNFKTWLLDAQQDLSAGENMFVIPSQDKFQHTELKPVDQEEVDMLDRILEQPILGSMMKYCLECQNAIVAEPMIFLARSDDPVILHEAIDYVKNNELAQNLIVVHFVDDREIVSSFKRAAGKAFEKGNLTTREVEESSNRHLLRAFMTPLDDPEGKKISEDSLKADGDPQSFLLARAWPKVPHEVSQLIVNVALLDAFYSSIRINCLVVRGAYFCPESVRWLSRFLDIPLNSMLMGMPDTNFKFPISDFTGCRIVLQPSGPDQREKTRHRLHDIHAFTEEMKNKSRFSSRISSNRLSAHADNGGSGSSGKYKANLKNDIIANRDVKISL